MLSSGQAEASRVFHIKFFIAWDLVCQNCSPLHIDLVDGVLTRFPLAVVVYFFSASS